MRGIGIVRITFGLVVLQLSRELLCVGRFHAGRSQINQIPVVRRDETIPVRDAGSSA